MFKKLFQHDSGQVSRTEPGYEENEQRTPWTGVVLLLIMFVAGLSFGWRAVDDLARVPARPADLSNCASNFAPANYRVALIDASSLANPAYRGGPWWGSDEEPLCEFNDLETAAGLPALDADRRRILEALRQGQATLRDDSMRANQRSQTLQEQYDLRLQERQAGVQTVSDEALAQLRQQMESAIEEASRLSAALEQRIVSDRAGSAELKAVEDRMRAVYADVFAAQQHRQRLYEFKVFLLQSLFVLPIFLLALWAYLKQLRRNSPYAIILTAIVGVMGVLLLRVVLVWFWGLFLAELLQELWRWIQNFELLRSIVFYLGMILSFVIFGGAVFYLQKRIFDPRRVAIRRFRQKQCPRCQTNLDLAGQFCPNCGHAIRTACSHCGQLRFVDLPHCPHCGK